LVEKIQIPVSEPSLEAAGVFRSLGDWNVLQGRFKQAADRSLKLVRASRVDKSDMTDEATRDLLRAAPTLVFVGDMTNYQQLVSEAIARFARTENPVAAEHVIKISVVTSMTPSTIKTLEPFAEVVKRSMEMEESASKKDIYMVAWRVFA